MRALGIAAALALTLVAGSAAAADESVPTRNDVKEARDAARDQERDVAAVQADLVLANQRLQESSIRAAQAAEAWNGARYELHRLAARPVPPSGAPRSPRPTSTASARCTPTRSPRRTS